MSPLARHLLELIRLRAETHGALIEHLVQEIVSHIFSN